MSHIFEFLTPFLVLGAATVVAILVFALFWRESTRLKAIEDTIRSVIQIHASFPEDEQRPSHIEELAKAEIRAVRQMVESYSSPELRSRLAPLVNLLGRSEQSKDDVAVLASIERMIAGERRSGLVESSLVSRIFAQRTPPAAPAPRTSTDDVEGTPKSPSGKQEKESSAASVVLLAEVTEKFYGSWAFRIVGFALIAAVVLAVTGNLIIGSTSVSLVGQMDNAAKSALQEITMRKGELKEQVQSGRDEISAETKNFKEQSASALASITARVLQSIETNASRSLEEFNKIVASARVKADALGRQLTPAQQEINRLSDEIVAAAQDMGGLSDLTERVRWAEDGLRSLNSGQESLNAAATNASVLLDQQKLVRDELLRKIDAATDDMGGVSRLSERVRWAEDSLRSLTNGRDSLHAAIAEASSVIVALRGEGGGTVAKPSTEVDAFEAKLQDLEERTAGIEKLLQSSAIPPRDGGAIAEPETDVDAFDAALRSLEERVAAIEKLPPPGGTPLAAGSIPLSEGDLDLRTWQDIQRALAHKKLYLAKIDGAPGEQTRKAIAAYQTERGVVASGLLTHMQIADLLAAPK